MTSQELSYVSLNDGASDTIVFLHGSGSTWREWQYVAHSQHLNAYHLLLVDLPGHGTSRDLRPCTIENMTKLLEPLIRAKAHGGVCHLVGLSMGGFAAITFAHYHPELVNTIFVTGVFDLKARYGRLIKLSPYLDALIGVLPKSVVDYGQKRFLGIDIMMPPGLERDMAENRRAGANHGVMDDLLKFGQGYAVSVRTLAVAAAKHDSVDGVRRLGEVLKQGNRQSRAVQIRDAIHGWSLQRPDYPDLFAEGVACWITEKPLPQKFELL